MLAHLKNLFPYVLLAGLLAVFPLKTLAFTKVVVPSVFKDWQNGSPSWATDLDIQKKYNFTVFTYQKLDPNASNYFEYNRGTETGVYLKYVVDHYDTFPDVAIFVHATPQRHQPDWLNMVGCISPNATWYHINYGYEAWITRGPDYWKEDGPVQEQCWRDVLQITWELKDNKEELLRRLPPNQPLTMRGPCCNQFLVSRAMVHKRPLHVWKELLQVIAMQPTCHVGDLDYENLYEFHRTGVRQREKPYCAKCGERADSQSQKGAYVQGHAGEHLNHIIFGHQEFQTNPRTEEEVCQNFLRGCPGSPCDNLPKLRTPTSSVSSSKSQPERQVLLNQDSVGKDTSERNQGVVTKSSAGSISSAHAGRERNPALVARDSVGKNTKQPVFVSTNSAGRIGSEHKEVFVSQSRAGEGRSEHH